LFRDFSATSKVHALVFFVLLMTGCFAVAEQAQTNPGSDSATPSANSAPSTNDKSAKDRVILKVGEQQITEGAFEQYIADLEATQGPADLSRKTLAENYSTLLMLAQQAQANHLDTSPVVLRQLAIDRNQILSNAEFLRLKDESKPTAQEIKAYYDGHLDDYDLVKIRRVFILGSANPVNGQGLTRAQAAAIATSVKQAISSHQDAMAVVQAAPHSRTDIVADPDPLTFVRGELPPTMDKAAFGLKEGEWTQLNDGPDEYVFIQLVAKSRKTLNDVSSQIEKQLQAEKLREELKALKGKSGIWLDEQYFASKAPVPGSTTQPDASGQRKSGAERGER
jgi:parvulin-like peptidyl-prolyl isomerase